MARFKTFADGGYLTPDNINTLRDEIDRSVSLWRTIRTGWANSRNLALAPGTAHNIIPGQIVFLGTLPAVVVVSGGTWSANNDFNILETWLMYLDSQVYGERTARLRWRIQLAPNSVAYAANLTFGLYAVTSIGSRSFGGTGGWPRIQGTDTAVAGSAYTVGPPSAGGQGSLSFSPTMTMPAAGHYVLGVTANVVPALGSEMVIRADLQFKAEKNS